MNYSYFCNFYFIKFLLIMYLLVTAAIISFYRKSSSKKIKNLRIGYFITIFILVCLMTVVQRFSEAKLVFYVLMFLAYLSSVVLFALFSKSTEKVNRVLGFINIIVCVLLGIFIGLCPSGKHATITTSGEGKTTLSEENEPVITSESTEGTTSTSLQEVVKEPIKVLEDCLVKTLETSKTSKPLGRTRQSLSSLEDQNSIRNAICLYPYIVAYIEKFKPEDESLKVFFDKESTKENFLSEVEIVVKNLKDQTSLNLNSLLLDSLEDNFTKEKVEANYKKLLLFLDKEEKVGRNPVEIIKKLAETERSIFQAGVQRKAKARKQAETTQKIDLIEAEKKLMKEKIKEKVLTCLKENNNLEQDHVRCSQLVIAEIIGGDSDTVLTGLDKKFFDDHENMFIEIYTELLPEDKKTTLKEFLRNFFNKTGADTLDFGTDEEKNLRLFLSEYYKICANWMLGSNYFADRKTAFNTLENNDALIFDSATKYNIIENKLKELNISDPLGLYKHYYSL